MHILTVKDGAFELVDKFNHFILSQFQSKKNTVVHLTFNRKTESLPKEVVIKIFTNESADNEYDTLKHLYEQEILVPKIIFYKKPFLILEKIEGINLCDFINDRLLKVADLDSLDSTTRKELVMCIEKLANWLSKLHINNIIEDKEHSHVKVLNKGDTRLRDFIYNLSDDKMVGLDFEDSYQGNHIDDIAWICCSLLDTNPGIFEKNNPKAKIELLNLFLKSYYRINPATYFDFKYFTEKLIENLNTVMSRRGIDMVLNKDNFIKEISRDM
ncbi:MAG: RIO1 family regulatory kinase/ATPase domain-containing protein [Promethearchaeota archaeon]